MKTGFYRSFVLIEMTQNTQPTLANIIFDTRKGAPALREQLYFHILRLIKEKGIQVGDQMPSSRTLSETLKVARSTVVAAYNRLLEEGILESREGSGTFVSCTADSIFRPENTSASKHTCTLPKLPIAARTATKALSLSVQKEIPFAVIAPDKESLPGKAWTTIVARISKSPWLHNGYCQPGGFRPYKEAICNYLRLYRGLNCEPDQVIATDGIQQALDLCASVLFEKKDRVAVEDPYFQTHLELLEFRGLKPVPIPVSPEGISTPKLHEEKNIKGVLITPNHQYPLGYAFSAETIRKILDWASKENAWILEDDYDSELRYGKKLLPALSAEDRDGRCIYMGSFTKVIYPGFNAGYMVVPKPLIKVFEGAKMLVDRHSSEVHQYILAEFIKGGFYYSHIRRLKRIYEQRRQAAVRAIGKYLSKFGKIEGANEGTHITFIFNRNYNDVEISARLLADYQLESRPLSACYRTTNPLYGLILGYAHFSEEELTEAVLRLKNALEKILEIHDEK